MQKKKLISIAIALTLQSYYIPAIAAENNDDEKECPSNISSLPKEKRAKLSPTCLATPENDNHWGWVAGGVAALVAGVAIGVENNGGGDSNHSYTPPKPDNGGDVTPPDDGGNVTPPDDGGNVTPPDDGGDDNVTRPTIVAMTMWPRLTIAAMTTTRPQMTLLLPSATASRSIKAKTP